MKQAAKTYNRRFFAAMAAYVVVLFVSVEMIEWIGDSPWRIPLALAPIVPIGFALWAFLTYLGEMDELQQRIQLRAFALAALTTGLLTFSYGFLEIVGFSSVSLLWIFPTMLGLWGVAVGIMSRRYR
ncbi:MAG: hypothetical protein U5L04_15665 [Trueperaceae bacterium]|nr:hypothetical protein [Trueperaceae bacterium]